MKDSINYCENTKNEIFLKNITLTEKIRELE